MGQIYLQQQNTLKDFFLGLWDVCENVSKTNAKSVKLRSVLLLFKHSERTYDTIFTAVCLANKL
jgi:hypothetical protein